MSDFSAFLRYYAVSLGFALILFPSLQSRLRFFSDQGWAFLRILSIVFMTWLGWMLSSLRILPFTDSSAQVLFLIFAICGALIAFQQKALPFKLSKSAWVSEFVFFTVLAVWTYLRGFAPDISGLEKFMDYGFVQSILRTDYAPPLDPWLASEPINYYYLGHWMAALLIRLSGVPPEIGYNLQMSWIFAMGAQLIWMLANTLAKTRYFAGFMGVCFAFVFGNAHALIFWPIKGSEYWYPAGTRFIHNTIHEYPMYSFVVNDLHGHVTNIPNTFLFLSILAWIHFQGWRWWRAVLLTFSIGMSFTMNAWDLAIHLLIAGGFIWFREAEYQWRRLVKPSVLSATAQYSVVLVIASLLWVLPFWLQLHPPSKGIEWVNWDMMTPVYQLLIVWGTQWPLLALFVSLIVISYRKGGVISQNLITPEKPKKTAPKNFKNHVIESLDPVQSEVLPLLKIWLLGGLVLILIPEVLYVKDIYPGHPRANTMFKMYYQAWLVLSLVIAIFSGQIIKAFTAEKFKKRWVQVGVGLIVFAFASGLTSTYRTYQQGMRLFGQRTGLDGLQFMFHRLNDDWHTVHALRKLLIGQPVVLEAVGESYTDYARISAFVGVPTVLGWTMHEWLWRGTIDQEIQPRTAVSKKYPDGDRVNKRQDHVREIYEGKDDGVTLELLRRYEVRLVVIGDLERKKYPSLNEAKIKRLSTRVLYSHGNTSVYEVLAQL